MTKPPSGNLSLAPAPSLATEAPAKPDEGREFDWLEDADDVIVRSQPAIAVHPGPSGVVIRRQGDWNDDDDGVIWFAVEHAPAIAMAILAAANLDATALTPEGRSS